MSVPPPAPSHPLATWLFDRYVRRLVGRHFAAVHLGPHDSVGVPAPRPAQDGRAHGASALFVANHTNWWDGFLAWLVSRELGMHFQILMEATNLDRYWMFKWIGALPLQRDSVTGSYADLTAATRHLERPSTSLWIFPQGRRSPPAARLTRTERGAAHIAVTAPTGTVVHPVAFRYAFLAEQLPEAFILLGEPIAVTSAERRTVAETIEVGMQEMIGQLDARLETESMEGFTSLLRGRLSINKRLDRVRHAAGTLPGPFEERNG